MGEVARQGRTVLFVSHNMAAVRSLCTRGIVLDRGKVGFDGEVERAIYGYFDSLTTRPERDSGAQVEFTDVRINGRPTGAIQSSQPFTAACSFTLRAPLPSFRLLCVIQNVNSEPLVVIPLDHRAMDDLNTEGTHDLGLSFPVLWLRPGVYSLHFRLQANNLAPGKATYVSDSVMLDVTGEMPSEMLIGELTPEVVWSGNHGRQAALARTLGGAV
jgi:lipopolysaccharide transport system ATP-binding protein